MLEKFFEAKLFPIAIQDEMIWSLLSLVSEYKYVTLLLEALGLKRVSPCQSLFHLSLQLLCKTKVAFTGEGSEKRGESYTYKDLSSIVAESYKYYSFPQGNKDGVGRDLENPRPGRFLSPQVFSCQNKFFFM